MICDVINVADCPRYDAWMTSLLWPRTMAAAEPDVYETPDVPGHGDGASGDGVRCPRGVRMHAWT
jgi:hypothetical protein